MQCNAGYFISACALYTSSKIVTVLWHWRPHRSVLPSSRPMQPSVLVTNGPAAGPHTEFSGSPPSTVRSELVSFFFVLLLQVTVILFVAAKT